MASHVTNIGLKLSFWSFRRLLKTHWFTADHSAMWTIIYCAIEIHCYLLTYILTYLLTVDFRFSFAHNSFPLIDAHTFLSGHKNQQLIFIKIVAKKPFAAVHWLYVDNPLICRPWFPHVHAGLYISGFRRVLSRLSDIHTGQWLSDRQNV